jgi:hypothetical protein
VSYAIRDTILRAVRDIVHEFTANHGAFKNDTSKSDDLFHEDDDDDDEEDEYDEKG